MSADWTWGATPTDGGTRFRLWAPGVPTLSLVLPDGVRTMDAVGDGWFECVADVPLGTEYAFRLPDGMDVPDPASRLQSGDVHGTSVVTDTSYEWRHDRPDTPWHDAVIYELHIGTFTPEGTYTAAMSRLPHLRDLGVTVVEIMPVAQYGGDRGWGYDGVLPYAPHPAYGTPDDLRALIDAAHAHGLMVLMDVVYNHFGPDGNYLHLYAADFFDPSRQTPWGAAIDYSREPVRRFFIENALYWLRDFNCDGLRLDAIDHIRDATDPELLVQLAREAHALGRMVHLTTEDNRNVTHLHERENGAVTRMTAEWNDDWHNAAHVLLTGETEGYYDAYADDPTGLLLGAMANGFSTRGAGGKGTASGHLQPDVFIDFLQNHDQIGNRAMGERLTTLADPARLRALQAVLLLSPHVPMIFMGDEWDETAPFLFFADFDGDLGRAVTEGRRKEFEKFADFATSDVPDPIRTETFERSRIDWDKAGTDAGRAAIARHRELLALRRARVAPLIPGTGPGCGRILDAPDRCLAVDWKLGGGVLSVRANLSDDDADLPEARGERIHLTGDAPGAAASAAFWIS
ncbi:malto-oligosyltrehalose trehalohydrolase [Jannaschia aquimarina]|uniref:Malto-oligosyltrehalose trehalohydrolase n=1 Tax=Jannaschia aquimarina TaxID=935700 RepID=A0A0D1DC66_9RHOB|nr:malto-oligosyltrehalose trehalohydrolase [Jannaschia aquimarina]KIT17598.1 Malto-oligosyltrehalose trehalohydrolase [Jannaschia aquimarina]SNS71786.1 maltooligosyl trehalose hydrolase [Jannaschia aquimarina]